MHTKKALLFLLSYCPARNVVQRRILLVIKAQRRGSDKESKNTIALWWLEHDVYTTGGSPICVDNEECRVPHARCPPTVAAAAVLRRLLCFLQANGINRLWPPATVMWRQFLL